MQIEDLFDEEQKKKLKKWKSKKKKAEFLAIGGRYIGGRYTYEITPTGLGLAIIVRDNVLEDKINLTNVENW